MTRIRLTIADLMVMVLVVGGGFAALRNANQFWASATYQLTVLMLATSILMALARKGRARMAWAGFAAFGWTYVLMQGLPPWASGGLGFGPIPRPSLLIEWAFAQLEPRIKPRPAGSLGLPFAYEQVSLSLSIILFGLVGAVIGRGLASRDERPLSPQEMGRGQGG